MKKEIPHVFPDPRIMFCPDCGREMFHAILHRKDDSGRIAWHCWGCGKVTDID